MNKSNTNKLVGVIDIEFWNMELENVNYKLGKVNLKLALYDKWVNNPNISDDELLKEFGFYADYIMSCINKCEDPNRLYISWSNDKKHYEECKLELETNILNYSKIR